MQPSVQDDVEEPLAGGAQTAGIVRVGATVRVPAHSRSGFVNALLRHLESVGFDGAPRSLGYDERGRHIQTFVDGEVMRTPPYALSDFRLRSAALLIRDFHDATAGSSLAGDQDVVCHGDLGPHNMIFRGKAAVAIVDWDADVAPGRRAVDFAHAVWCCADVTEASVPVAEQARRTEVMCRSYPGMTPALVVGELTARFHRARNQHATAGRDGAVEVFDGLIAWMARHGGQLESGGSGPTAGASLPPHR